MTTLRIGVLCGQRAIQRWHAEAITQLLVVPGVQPVVWLAMQQEDVEPPSRSASSRGSGKATKDPTGLFARIADRLPQPPRYQSLDLDDPERWLGALRTLMVGTAEDAPVIQVKDRDQLGSLQLDVLLVLSGKLSDLGPAIKPRHGCWGFHPPLSARGLDEDLFRDPGSAALQLIRQDASGEMVVLREARFAAIGLDAPVDAALMNCARWPAQVAREILAKGGALSGITDATVVDHITAGASFGTSGWFWKALRRKLFHPQQPPAQEWNIGILHQPITALLEENASMNVRWLPPPSSGRSRSEPFGYTADDQLNVLYRKHGGSSGQSSIARIRPKADNVLKRSRPMLEGAGISGYPFVVEREGAAYVVIAHTTGTDLYRVNAGNDGLDHVGQLIGRPLIAPTLFQAHGRWWLFATDPALPDTALLAFHASEMTGPYTPHNMNPLKLDARSARPAGTPFESAGSWWRPALDATDKDLYSVVLNRIDALTPDLFNEVPVKRLEPFRGTTYGHGFRTLCAMGQITLVDGLRSPMVAAAKANTSRGKRRSSSSKRK